MFELQPARGSRPSGWAARAGSVPPPRHLRRACSDSPGYFMPPNERVNPERDDGLAIAERPKVKRPRRYVVVFHNDDYTTMEFVVHVLMKFFHLDETSATSVMLAIHRKGYGVAG